MDPVVYSMHFILVLPVTEDMGVIATELIIK
jgi:hypothetical protein